jgi:BASS family bile acid:Na+ symporter
MAQILLLTLKFTVIALVLGIEMSSTLADISCLFKRPGLLFRSLAAMYLVVPLASSGNG